MTSPEPRSAYVRAVLTDARMDRKALALLIPRPLREFPPDLAAVLVVVLLTDALALVWSSPAGHLRIAAGLLFVFWAPGYAVTAALFPRHGGGTGPGSLRAARISGVERAALSMGLSVGLVPLVGLVLNFTPWGIRPVPVLAALSALTVAATAVAVGRRLALPPAERFSVPLRRWWADARAWVRAPPKRRDRVLNLALAVLVVSAFAGFGYAVAVPRTGETFTEFSLLTRNESGDLVADGYPAQFAPGESREVVVAVGNHEHEPVTYTVVVELQRLRPDGSTAEQAELDRFDLRVAPEETRYYDHAVRPGMRGTDLRLLYLLYTSDPPPDPSRANAYRSVHIWISVG